MGLLISAGNPSPEFGYRPTSRRNNSSAAFMVQILMFCVLTMTPALDGTLSAVVAKSTARRTMNRALLAAAASIGRRILGDSIPITADFERVTTEGPQLLHQDDRVVVVRDLLVMREKCQRLR